MRPALLIVGAVLLVLWHFEAVHNARVDGFMDGIMFQEKNPTTGVGQNTPKEIRL